VSHQVVDAFVSAWDNHNAESLRATLSEDAIYEVVPQGRSFGPDRVTEQVDFMHSLSSDFSMKAVSVLRDGDRYAVEWELTGTNDGPFGPLGLEPSGRTFNIRGTWIIDTENEKIRNCRAYWDFAGLLRQLGATPGGQVGWQMAVWSDELETDTPASEGS
jgi:steroid delta-isomerase-like uncharacterized protein